MHTQLEQGSKLFRDILSLCEHSSQPDSVQFELPTDGLAPPAALDRPADSEKGKTMAKDREIELLDRVPTDGTGIGNTRLLRELDWEEQEFWEVRNRLIDRGVLELGRGRGGSVRRVLSVSTVVVPTPGTEPPPRFEQAVDALERQAESDLYLPITRVLDDKWTKDKRVESAIVQLTAPARPDPEVWPRLRLTK